MAGNMWKSPNRRNLEATISSEVEDGTVMAAHGWELVEKNRELFMDVYRFVKSIQRKELKGHLRARVVEHMMGTRWAMDEQFKFNNTRWAVLSRYLVLYDPSLEHPTGPISFRHSKVDSSGLFPVSWMGEDVSGEPIEGVA